MCYFKKKNSPIFYSMNKQGKNMHCRTVFCVCFPRRSGSLWLLCGSCGSEFDNTLPCRLLVHAQIALCAQQLGGQAFVALGWLGNKTSHANPIHQHLQNLNISAWIKQVRRFCMVALLLHLIHSLAAFGKACRISNQCSSNSDTNVFFSIYFKAYVQAAHATQCWAVVFSGVATIGEIACMAVYVDRSHLKVAWGSSRAIPGNPGNS